LTPTLTDFKGLINVICYRQISVIDNIENKEKLFKGHNNGFFLLADLLKRDLTVFAIL